MWEEWFQNVAGSVIKDVSQAKFQQPYEIQKLRLQALGDLGLYTEGVPQQVAPAGLFGMSQGAVVLLGLGLVVAFVALRD